MFNQIIKFVENDIDGCGTSAEVILLMKTDDLLTKEHQNLFEKAIEEIKNEWKDDG